VAHVEVEKKPDAPEAGLENPLSAGEGSPPLRGLGEAQYAVALVVTATGRGRADGGKGAAARRAAGERRVPPSPGDEKARSMDSTIQWSTPTEVRDTIHDTSAGWTGETASEVWMGGGCTITGQGGGRGG